MAMKWVPCPWGRCDECGGADVWVKTMLTATAVEDGKARDGNPAMCRNCKAFGSMIANEDCVGVSWIEHSGDSELDNED